MLRNDEKRTSCRDKLIAALETEIKKQNEIIEVQEDSINILMEHNEKLVKILDGILIP